MATKVEYIGRYTISEYAIVKQWMIQRHPELKHHKIDEICRYIAKFDWPQERRDSYMTAKEDGDFTARLLQIYDEAQELFDKVHHGENFLRFYFKIYSVPESDRTHDESLVAQAVAAKMYTGPVPQEYAYLVEGESDGRTA